MKKMMRKLVSLVVVIAVAAGLAISLTGFTGSSHAQASTPTHVQLAQTGQKERDFVQRIHQAHIQTNLNDQQLAQLGRDLTFLYEKGNFESTAYEYTSPDQLASLVKDNSLGINSFEAMRIVHIWWDVYSK